MKELKLTDPLKAGYYAYHVSGGKINDFMKIGGGYLKPVANDVKTIISDGWSFVSRTKKYKKGQKVSIPKSQIIVPKEKEFVPPPKIIGAIIKNGDSKNISISCLTLRNAWDTLLNAMTVQDERDFLNGTLCVSLQIIKTPEQFISVGTM
jgi:hypothetical protein